MTTATQKILSVTHVTSLHFTIIIILKCNDVTCVTDSIFWVVCGMTDFTALPLPPPHLFPTFHLPSLIELPTSLFLSPPNIL